jgi:hypothetical protein
LIELGQEQSEQRAERLRNDGNQRQHRRRVGGAIQRNHAYRYRRIKQSKRVKLHIIASNRLVQRSGASRISRSSPCPMSMPFQIL